MSKIDVRIKLSIIISLSLASIFTANIPFIIFIYLSALIITQIVGGDIFFPLRKYKFLFSFVFSIFILHSIFSRVGDPVISINNFTILYDEGLRRFILAGMTIMIILTTPTMLSDVSEKEFFNSMKKLKLPHSLLIPLLTAYRFIPLIKEKANDTLNILRLRQGIIQRNRIFINLSDYLKILFPIMISSIFTARKLATVLDLRGFRGNETQYSTKLNSLVFSDYLTLALLFSFLISVFVFINN